MGDHVEIHKMSVANRIMTKGPVPGGFAVRARGSVALKPGRSRLIPIGPKQPFQAGDTIPMVRRDLGA